MNKRLACPEPEIRCSPEDGRREGQKQCQILRFYPVASIINVPIVVMSVSDRLTEHGRRLRIWAAEISPRGADDVIEMTLRQVLRVARVVELEP